MQSYQTVIEVIDKIDVNMLVKLTGMVDYTIDKLY